MATKAVLVVPAFKITVEPLDASGNVLTRGKTTTKDPEELDGKMDYAAKRCPKFSLMRATLEQNGETTVGHYTRGENDRWQYQAPLPTGPEAVVAQDTTAQPKKVRTTPPAVTDVAKGKPGVINEIVSLLQAAQGQTGGGTTVEEIVTALGQKFPSRDVASMEITVRCQLGRIPKQRKLPILKQRDGKVVRYHIASA